MYSGDYIPPKEQRVKEGIRSDGETFIILEFQNLEQFGTEESDGLASGVAHGAGAERLLLVSADGKAVRDAWVVDPLCEQVALLGQTLGDFDGGVTL